MTVLRAALCQQQIVIAILLIDMRSFRIAPAKTYTQMVYLAELLARLHVNLAYLDVALLPQEIAAAILEIQGRVATAPLGLSV